MEEISLFLKEILQCFLDCIERFIVCLKNLEGIAIIVALIGIFFYIDGIFGLFHDSFPLAIDLVEQGCLLRKIFHCKRRFEDRFEVYPVFLMKIPLINQILHVP